MRAFCFLIGCLSIWALGCTARAPEPEPEIGKTIEVPQKAVVEFCMTSSAQLDLSLEVTVNRIKYVVAYREDRFGRKVVTYVHTDDPAFKSPEGLHVGDVVAIESPEHLVINMGWESYSREGYGWIPVVSSDGSEVDVVRESQADEKRRIETLKFGGGTSIGLRIKGFTKRARSPQILMD